MSMACSDFANHNAPSGHRGRSRASGPPKGLSPEAAVGRRSGSAWFRPKSGASDRAQFYLLRLRGHGRRLPRSHHPLIRRSPSLAALGPCGRPSRSKFPQRRLRTRPRSDRGGNDSREIDRNHGSVVKHGSFPREAWQRHCVIA
jgi:hypothetical protein